MCVLYAVRRLSVQVLTAQNAARRGRMELRLLDVEDFYGVALIRDKLNLSAAFLVPYLLQIALSADLKVGPRRKREYAHSLIQYNNALNALQIVLLLAQDCSSHYQQVLRKLVRT